MSSDEVVVERDEAIALVTINRPRVLNALDTRTLTTLGRVMAELEHDEDVRAVILTGAGDRAFVAGADISELAALLPTGGGAYAARGQAVLAALERMGKPVIAAINGVALGGGCELAMACTLRLVADTAVLGLPEVKLGLIPGYGGTQRLSRLVGRGRAMELILRGRNVDAQEAAAIGLVNRVVPRAELITEARALATELAANASVAIRSAMEAVGRGADMPFAEACSLEAALFGLVVTTEDRQEGTRAFLDKRSPKFRGR